MDVLFLLFLQGSLISKNLRFFPLGENLSQTICNIYPVVKPSAKYLFPIKNTLQQNEVVPSILCVNRKKLILHNFHWYI